MSTILIIGETGSGKTFSLRKVNGDETILINATNKPMPFKGMKKKFKKNTIFTDNYKIIVNKIQEANRDPLIKSVIIDDFQAIMTNAYMSTIENKGYEKYNQIGKSVWSILTASNSCRHDLKIFLLAHSDTDANGKIKCKTVGRLVDEKICIEGMCTIVLHSKINDGNYVFQTQNNGISIAKSPIGMFNTLEIENDLAQVIKAIDEYYDEDDLIDAIKFANVDDILKKIQECRTIEELGDLYNKTKNYLFENGKDKIIIDSCAKRKKEIIEDVTGKIIKTTDTISEQTEN